MSAWGDRARALGRRTPDGARVAELGFGVGNMAKVLAQSRPDIRLTIVDNFLGAEDQPERYKATRDNFAKRSAEEAERRYEDALTLAAAHDWRVIRADTVEASRLFPPLSFDVVFIDADHSEEGVWRDIGAWEPLARRWIGGHDYDNTDPRFDFSGVRRAVDARYGARVELDLNFTWWVRL